MGHYPALKYGSDADVAAQRPLLAEAGAAVEAYSGQTVTLDGSGSRVTSGATYLWERMPDGAEPMVTINGRHYGNAHFPGPHRPDQRHHDDLPAHRIRRRPVGV